MLFVISFSPDDNLDDVITTIENTDIMDVVNKLKGKAACFMRCHSWNGAEVAIKDNKNYMEMMNSKAVITCDVVLPVSF